MHEADARIGVTRRLTGYAAFHELGRNAQGPIHSALHVATNRIVAIRFLDPTILDVPEAAGNILNNWRTAARLDHPNIIRVAEVRETPDAAWMIAELVEGETLTERMHRTHTIEPDEATRVMLEAARAVQYAWSRGVGHGNLTPNSIFIEEATPHQIRVDYTSAIFPTPVPIGNPRFLSIEQVRGLPPTERSDIYALGMILHEALTGETPFSGVAGTQQLIRRVTEDPPPVGTLATEAPRRLTDAIDRCIRRDPAERWDAGELIRALETA